MISIDTLSGAGIVALFDEKTVQWHLEPAASTARNAFERAVETLHRANFELWHEEDKARDLQAGDAAVAAAKRAIDRINQQRNDQAEQCDTLLLEWLAPKQLPKAEAELHSETPGMMLDRLSILTLKRYHTMEEMQRTSAPEGHGERNRQRLAILQAQRDDLAECFDRLWQQVLRGKVGFQTYRQLKMYNDPELNPVLYQPRKG